MNTQIVMQNYHDLMQRTLAEGKDQVNQRTGEICRTLVGEQLTYKAADGFPCNTARKFAFKNCRGELLGFFRGYTNAADFRAIGCNVWDDNADKTPAWLANRHRKGKGDNGRIYGAQWTDWKDRRFVDAVERAYLLQEGFVDIMQDKAKGLFGMERSINQLESVLRTLLTNPSDRRLIVSGWNIAEFDQMSLPPCHVDYRFAAFDDNTLSVVCTMRSWDEFLGFNVPLTAMFLEIMARLSGRVADRAVVQVSNAHLYSMHFAAVEEMLSRTQFPAPRLVLSDNIKPVTLDEVEGAFLRIQPEDISLQGYQSHDAIKVEMAV